MFEDAVIALENHFVTNWATSPFSDYLYYFGNMETGESTENDDPWVRITILPEVGGQIEMGGTVAESTARYSGWVYIDIFVRGGHGLQKSAQIADIIAVMFRVQQIELRDSGLIRTRRPTHNPIGTDKYGWYVYQLQIPYIRDVNEAELTYLIDEASIYIKSEDETFLVEIE